MKYEDTVSILKNVVKTMDDSYDVFGKRYVNTVKKLDEINEASEKLINTAGSKLINAAGGNKVMNILDKINRGLTEPLDKLHNGYEGDESADNYDSGESFGLEEYKDYYEEPNNRQSNKENENTKSYEKNSMGLIDSITQEITPVRLQQAIILSEIVGKPRSKTRKRRRF